MLTNQPRFSGNGGHGKRLADDPLISKREPVKPGNYGVQVAAVTPGERKQFARKGRNQGAVVGGILGGLTGASLAEDYGTYSHHGISGRRLGKYTAAGTVVGAGTLAALGHRRGKNAKYKAKFVRIDKRARTYDSELNRQRRRGMYTTGAAAGSGALGYAGYQGAKGGINAGRDARTALSRIDHPGAVIGEREWDQGRSVLARNKARTDLSRSTPNAKHPEGTSRGKPHLPLPGHTTLQHGKPENIGPLTGAERKALDHMSSLRGKISGRSRAAFAGSAVLGATSLRMYRNNRKNSQKRWN